MSDQAHKSRYDSLNDEFNGTKIGIDEFLGRQSIRKD